MQWQQDTLNIGPICVAFQGNGQSQSGDVGMSGTTMCMMDANCQQSGSGAARSTMSAQAFDRLAAVLAEIRPRFGAGAFSDRRRVIGLLADKAPDAKREIRVVGTAIDEGIPAALARTERHLVGVEMDRLANGLEASTGLRLDIARQVVRAFAFAMDLGPLPSIYEAAATPRRSRRRPRRSAAPDRRLVRDDRAGPAPSQPQPAPISQYPPHSQPTQTVSDRAGAPRRWASSASPPPGSPIWPAASRLASAA